MIIKAKDIRTTSQEKLRGGTGRVDMAHFLNEDNSCGVGRVFAMATIPPGSSIGEHPHINEYEVYYVVDGTVHVTDNDNPAIPLEKGDCMICHDGDKHSIENKSDRDATVLFLVMYPNKEKMKP